MNLIDTIPLLESGDPADKFRAEFYQTAIRYDRARRELNGENASIPKELLDSKVKAMRSYLTVMQAESAIRGIPVSIDDVRRGSIYDKD